eukprot:7851865-Pyramimonas_sp.AAC.1
MADLFALRDHALIASASVQLLSMSSLWRCACRALVYWRGDFHAWSEQAIQDLPLVAWLRGERGAPCWHVRQGTARRFHATAERAPSAGVSFAQWHAAAAPAREELSNAQAMGRKAK